MKTDKTNLAETRALIGIFETILLQVQNIGKAMIRNGNRTDTPTAMIREICDYLDEEARKRKSKLGASPNPGLN